jgi:hypothetical protein
MDDSPACIHNILEGNIQEYVFTEVSRRAIDELFFIIENLLIEAAKNNPAAMQYPALVDSRVGIQPLNYAFIRMQPFIREYPSMRGSRVAMIVPPGPLIKTISMIMRSIAPVRFYSANEYERALTWLRDSVTTPSSSQSSR